MSWTFYAAISAIAAAATAILAKIGVEGVPSNVATAIRTGVIIVFAWSIAIGLKEHHALSTISRRAFVFLVLSGIATGVSWLAYYRALQLAPASQVAPIDKLSLPLTIILAAAFLGEAMTWKLMLGHYVLRQRSEAPVKQTLGVGVRASEDKTRSQPPPRGPDLVRAPCH